MLGLLVVHGGEYVSLGQGFGGWPGYVRFSKGPVRLDPVPLGSQQMYVRFSRGSVRLDPVPLGCQQMEQLKQC